VLGNLTLIMSQVVLFVRIFAVSKYKKGLRLGEIGRTQRAVALKEPFSCGLQNGGYFEERLKRLDQAQGEPLFSDNGKVPAQEVT